MINWIDEHKLVKFVEEGRDADMERILENHSSPEHQQQQHEQEKDSSSKISS